jgi:hypothetical protein
MMLCMLASHWFSIFSVEFYINLHLTIFIPLFTLLPPKMQLTSCAVFCLRRGAEVGSEDVNAVDIHGIEFFAAQVQCEDDKQLRKSLLLQEFQPVLQIHSVTWLGTFGKYPSLRFIVIDGDGDSMAMYMSHRIPHTLKSIFSKAGPFSTGRLNSGKRFRLLDYTTILHRNKDGTIEPRILIEKLRTQPRSK